MNELMNMEDEIKCIEVMIADLEGDLYDQLFECHCCQGYGCCDECYIKKEIKEIEKEICDLENETRRKTAIIENVKSRTYYACHE